MSELEIIYESDNGDEINSIKDEARRSHLKNYIQNNHPDAAISDVSFERVWGVYGQTLVAQFYDGEYHGVWQDEEKRYEIGGLTFDISIGYPILVWKDNEIFELSAAYDKGLFTKENLSDIYNLYLIL